MEVPIEETAKTTRRIGILAIALGAFLIFIVGCSMLQSKDQQTNSCLEKIASNACLNDNTLTLYDGIANNQKSFYCMDENRTMEAEKLFTKNELKQCGVLQ